MNMFRPVKKFDAYQFKIPEEGLPLLPNEILQHIQQRDGQWVLMISDTKIRTRPRLERKLEDGDFIIPNRDERPFSIAWCDFLVMSERQFLSRYERINDA